MISTRGISGRGTRGYDRRRKGARVECSSMDSMPNLDMSETSFTPTAEIKS